MPAAEGVRAGRLGRLLARVTGDELGRQLAKGAVFALAINVLGLLANLGSQIALTRFLGDEGFGIYIYAFGWANLLVVPAVLGLNTVQLRFVSVYVAREEWGLLRGLLRFSARVQVVTSTVVCGAAALVLWHLQERLEPALVQAFWVGLLLIPVLTLVRTHTDAVRALGRVVVALAPENVGRPLLLLLGVGALGLLWPDRVEAVTAMAVTLLAALLALAFLSHVRRRLMPVAARHAAPQQRPRLWLTTCLPLFLFEATAVASNQASFLLLGWLTTTTDAGIYAIAMRLAMLVALPLKMVTIVFAPKIAALHARDDRAALQRMVTMTAWWTTLGALIAGLPLVVLPEFFLSLFGRTFAEEGGLALRILILGQLVNAMTGSVGAIMNMTGLEKRSALILMCALLLNLALGFALIPSLGIEGAAIAGACGVAAASIGAVVVVWHHRRILSGVFASLAR